MIDLGLGAAARARGQSHAASAPRSSSGQNPPSHAALHRSHTLALVGDGATAGTLTIFMDPGADHAFRFEKPAPSSSSAPAAAAPHVAHWATGCALRRCLLSREGGDSREPKHEITIWPPCSCSGSGEFLFILAPLGPKDANYGVSKVDRAYAHKAFSGETGIGGKKSESCLGAPPRGLTAGL